MAAPLVGALGVLLWRSEKRNDIQAEELRRANERLAGFLERYAGLLSEAVGTMDEIAGYLREADPPPPPPRGRQRG